MPRLCLAFVQWHHPGRDPDQLRFTWVPALFQMAASSTAFQSADPRAIPLILPTAKSVSLLRGRGILPVDCLNGEIPLLRDWPASVVTGWFFGPAGWEPAFNRISIDTRGLKSYMITSDQLTNQRLPGDNMQRRSGAGRDPVYRCFPWSRLLPG